MIETQTTETETNPIVSNEDTTVVAPSSFNPFSDSSWQESTNLNEPVLATEAAATSAEIIADAPVTESGKTEETGVEILTASNPIKEKLGFDDIDAAAAAFNELKAKAEKVPEDFKFANEESRKLFEYIKEGKSDEAYEVLDRQRKLSQADKLDAASAIRLKIELDNPHFSASDVADVFEENYLLDEKPEQELEEEDDKFSKRLKQWEAKSEKIARKIERDGVAAKTSLSKSRSELVLPDIKKEAPVAAGPSPEELEKAKAYSEAYLRSVDESLSSFSGFKVTAKDKEVEIPVSYTLSDEQKGDIKKMMTEFSDVGLDANRLFAPRWLKEDGTINSLQVARDLAQLKYGDQFVQRAVNETAARRLEAKLKADSNITLKNQPQSQRTFAPQPAGIDGLREQMFKGNFI